MAGDPMPGWFLASLPQGWRGTYDPFEFISAISGDAAVSEFITKDSGQREEFETGAQRDTQEGKPRFDLIPIDGLRRIADVYARGAKKYSENNWRKGMAMSRVYASLLRHIFQWAEGDRVEDHLGSVCFGALALMHYEEQIHKGALPATLDDMPGAEQRHHEHRGSE